MVLPLRSIKSTKAHRTGPDPLDGLASRLHSVLAEDRGTHLAKARVAWTDAVLKAACELALRYGLAAMDAVHVAGAMSAGADELVTGEDWNKPMLQVKELRGDLTEAASIARA